MNLGFFALPCRPPGYNLTEALKEDREIVLLADELGYTEGFIGEHITDTTESITSSLVFIAWLLQDTKNIMLGTGTVSLPNHHPARVAAEVAMVDHMAEGRFLFGISPGVLMSDVEAFGNIENDRTEMFVEAINQILAIWENDPPYNLKGKHWNISTEKTQVPALGQGIIPGPYQRPHPPIIITAVAPFAKGIAAGAERGWDPISVNFLQPESVASHWTMYVQGCEAVGRSAEPKNWRVAKSIFVADNDSVAEKYVRATDGPYHAYYDSLLRRLQNNGQHGIFKTEHHQSDNEMDSESILDQLVIRGSVNRVVEQILAFREETGDFGTLLYVGHHWSHQELARRSMELMATKVMPKINESLR